MKNAQLLLIMLLFGFSAAAQPCNTPGNLRAVAYSFNSLTLDWASGGANSWQIRYVQNGGNLSAASPVNVSSKPFTIVGLSQSTSYAIQVRDSCSNGFSAWTSFITASTSCTPLSLPFTANFDGAAWTSGPFTNSPGTINACWQRFDGNGNNVWKVGPPTFVFNSGADDDHTSGNGQYMYVERIGFGGFGADSVMLESVLFDLSTVSNPQLSFWYHMFGADIEDLRVYVSNDFGLNYTQVISISGQQQNSTSAAWKERIVNLNAYANDTVRVRFVAAESTPGFNNAICIDDVSVGAAPSCPRPQNLSLQSVSFSTATLTWQSGGANNWQIEYGSPGFTQGNGTLVNTSTNPTVLTGLTASTTYQAYVRDSCGANDVSVWEGPFSFTTLCLPVSAPYTENFDGNSFVVGTFFNDTGSVDACWNRGNTNNYFWKPGPPVFPSFNTGPSGDNTSGNGQYLYTEANGFGANTTTHIESPLIDLSALTQPQLTFYCHMFGSDIQNLKVYVDDGSGYTLVNTQSGSQQNSKTTAWKEVIVSLSSYTNDTIRLRFSGTRTQNGFSSEIAIDDVEIDETPTCPKPQNFSVVRVRASTATLTWLSGGANNWNLSYGSPGFQANNGTIVNTSTNPGTLSGLSPSTTYEVYVRDSCGVGDVSQWAGPISFTTRCAPVAAPYFENFDGSSFSAPPTFGIGTISTCWNRDTTGRYVWGVADDGGFTSATGPDSDHTTGNDQFLVATQQFGVGIQNNTATTISSELVDLGPLNVPQLSFWYHMHGSAIDSMVAFIDNGSTTSRVWSAAGPQQNSATAPWQEAIVSLSNFANDTVSVLFKTYRTTNFSQAESAIDDLRLEETPSCPKPQNLSATASTTNSITLGWTSGGASNWQIEYGTPGFTIGTGTLVNASTNPFTVNGLSPSTTYEFYVRDSCGATDLSQWSAPLEVATDCGISPAPFLETFDNSNWQSNPSFFDPGDIDPCWNRSDTTGYHWRPLSGATPFFNTGPSSDNTSGNGKYLYSAFVFGGSNTSTNLVSTNIDLSTLSNPQLRFYTHRFGSAISKLDVEVSSGGNWSNVLTLSGANQNSSAAPWDEHIVSLTSFTNDTIQVRFVAEKTTGFSNQCNIAIDDFEIRETPSCPRPDSLSASAISSSSMQLSWISGGATNWQIRYRVAGSGSAFTTVNTTNNPYTLTGLNASTTYEIEVRDSCGQNDVSAWNGPLQATTLCGVITAPWTENFDGSSWVEGAFNNIGNQIDGCWSRPNANNPNFGPNSGSTFTFNTGPNADVSGSGNYIYTEASGASGNSTGQISSPQIFIPLNLSNPQLKFAYHMHGSGIGTLDIEIKTPGGSFTNVYSLTGQQQNASTAAWKFDSLSLSNYVGDTVQVRFKASNTNFLGDAALDEVSINGQLIPCADPTNLSFSNVSTNSFDVSWSSSSPIASSVLSYYNLSQGAGSATVINAASSPQSLSGLQTAGTYVVSVYDSCGTTISGSISDTLTLCDSVTANFNFTTTFLTASFNAQVSASTDSVRWDFSGLSGSSLLNPNITFGMPGTYPVTLYAFNACGQYDSITKNVRVCDSLTASFTHSLQGDTSVFAATASSNALGFIWDFDDGLSASGASKTVKIAYPTGGTKNVVLKVYNACGDTISVAKTITICPPPVAAWTYTILSPINSGLRVQFDGTASTNATSYSWNFGDGNTGTGPTPIHIYATPGLFYQVELTVTNDCGGSDSRKFALSEIGLDENTLRANLKVFPNPASEVLNLHWDPQGLEPIRFKLYNSQGQAVLSQSAAAPNSGRAQLNIAALASGMYFLHLESNSGTLVKNILVK